MARQKNGFALVCADTSDKTTPLKCACDFRINLRGCSEETIIYTASIILLPYLLLISTISAAFIYDQVHVKRQSVLFPSRERGIIRTKPQFSFNIAVCIFHLVQATSLSLLILDAFPNAIYAEFFAYFSREVGYAFSVFYPISIVYSTPGVHSSYTIQSQWKPKKQHLDLFAICLMVGPFISNIPLSLLTGHYVEVNDISTAEAIYLSNSVVWCLWILQYVATLLYVYHKLVSNMRVITNSLQRRYRNDPEIDFVIRRLKVAGRLLSWTAGLVASVFFIHFLESLFFGLFYRKLLLPSHPIRNFLYYSLWYLTVPIICNISQIVMYYYYYKQQNLTSNGSLNANALHNLQPKVRPEVNSGSISVQVFKERRNVRISQLYSHHPRSPPYSHLNDGSFGSTLLNSLSGSKNMEQSAPLSGTTIVSSENYASQYRSLCSRSNPSLPSMSNYPTEGQSYVMMMSDYNHEEVDFVEELDMENGENVRRSWLNKRPIMNQRETGNHVIIT